MKENWKIILFCFFIALMIVGLYNKGLLFYVLLIGFALFVGYKMYKNYKIEQNAINKYMEKYNELINFRNKKNKKNKKPTKFKRNLRVVSDRSHLKVINGGKKK